MAMATFGRMPSKFDQTQHPFSCGEAFKEWAEEFDDYIPASAITDEHVRRMQRKIGYHV